MKERPRRGDYRYAHPLTTRWADNDVYGHVNNVAYYAFFDSAANAFLIGPGGLDIHGGDVIGLVVESACQYHAPVAYPSPLVAMVRVDRLGTRAVTYGIAVFTDDPAVERDERDRAVAHGHFVHVFVDRATRRPVAMPERLRAALATITI